MNKEELYDLAKPISDWIRKNGNPYSTVIITGEMVKVTSDEFSAPFAVELNNSVYDYVIRRD